MELSDLPSINASLNGLSSLLLTFGYCFIRLGKRKAHRNCMLAAFCTSTLFLVCYLSYHVGKHYVEGSGVTRFTGAGWLRDVYFAVLLTHTILAAVIIPLVLVTLHRALKGQFETHHRIARWTWPLWIYVSVTGVLIYVLLYRLPASVSF